MISMRKSALLLALAAPFALAACSSGPEGEAATDREKFFENADACGASNYEQFVGQKSPEIVLPAGTVFRDYRSGDPVTSDLSPERINFEYDRSGVLVKVSCG